MNDNIIIIKINLSRDNGRVKKKNYKIDVEILDYSCTAPHNETNHNFIIIMTSTKSLNTGLSRYYDGGEGIVVVIIIKDVCIVSETDEIKSREIMANFMVSFVRIITPDWSYDYFVQLIFFELYSSRTSGQVLPAWLSYRLAQQREE